MKEEEKVEKSPDYKQVRSVYNTLQERTQHASGMLEELEICLSPIVRDADPEGSPNASTLVEGDLVPLGRDIRVVTHIVEDMIARMSSIMARLEL